VWAEILRGRQRQQILVGAIPMVRRVVYLCNRPVCYIRHNGQPPWSQNLARSGPRLEKIPICHLLELSSGQKSGWRRPFRAPRHPKNGPYLVLVTTCLVITALGLGDEWASVAQLLTAPDSGIFIGRSLGKPCPVTLAAHIDSRLGRAPASWR